MKKESFKQLEDVLVEGAIKRLECCPESYYVPSYSRGTFFIKLGWFRKLKCWDGYHVEIEDVRLSEENAQKLRDTIKKLIIIRAINKLN